MNQGNREAEFERLLRGIRGEEDVVDGEEVFGPIKGTSTTGTRILVIDDRSDIINDFRKSEEKYSSFQTELRACFYFFRVASRRGARLSDCINWISEQEPFEAIYIDGLLKDQGNGVELARRIRELPGLKYQPIAIITAIESFFLEQTATTHETRIMGKFELTGRAAIRKFRTDLPDLQTQAREMFWTDCQKELSVALDGGLGVREAAERLGSLLRDHYGISAWYFRELRGDTLDAIAMDDGLFEAGEKLNLDNSPDFQKELVFSSKPNADSWQFLNELTEKQVGARPGMLGHHAIAARVGSTLGGGVIALLTAYRKPEDRKFFESDARNLHHAAVLLRLALATQRTNERLEALTDAIGTVLRASSTAQITASLCDFLHTQIQESLEFRGHKTKTTARLFLRGTGMLARWGEAERSKIGLLEEHGVKPISVNEDCVYSRAIISKQTKTSLDPEECDKKFKPTTRIKIHSYINVPLVYDGAAIGAINLETGLKDAYKQADVSIVEAVAGAAAAAVLNHRSQRFMTQLAQLTSLAVNPAASEPSDPDALLNRGAKILYELCGFSDFLLFEAQEVSDDPWQIVKAWEGDDCGNKINRRPLDTLEGMNHHISTRWQETFLKSCLDAKTNEVIFVSHGNQLGVTDDGDGLLRPRGRPTLSHVVVLFGEPDAQKTRALMLLFEHPSPIPGHFVQVFSDYSTFLNTIYSTTFAEIHNYGEALTAARIEARAGRVYSQVRHSIASQLASIYNAVDLGRRAKDADSDILDEVVERVRTAQEDFDKSRVLLKSPEYDTCDLVGLWRAVVEDMQPRIKAAGLRVETRSEEIEAYTDPKLASYVLFNLLDNALIHGKENGATLIWFEGLPDGKEGCAVCDNGNEIDPDLVRRIFNMGATTKSQGGGQGLFLSQGIANDLKGDLVLIRRDDANCFELRL